MIANNSIAAGNSMEVRQATLKPGVNRLERKPLIISTYDPTKTGITPETLYEVNSANHAGALFGFGFPIHRLAMKFFDNFGVGSVTVVPQEETSAKAAGSLTFTGTAGESKTEHFYFAFDNVSVFVPKTTTNTAHATLLAAAINANKNLPITAAVDGSTLSKVNITAKPEGLYGNYISIAHSLGYGESLASGVTVEVVDMTTGAGTPDIADALDALGTGTNKNENWYTCLVDSYGLETTVMDDVSDYNGSSAGEGSGCYDGEIARPFQCVRGYTVAGSAGKTALEAITDLRTEDMTNCYFWRPGSNSHPAEIAAAVMGVIERKRVNRPQVNYVNDVLKGIDPGVDSDDYNGNSNLDDCVKNGISTSSKDGSYARIQDLITGYRPESVDVDSNIYRSMRHNAITQNILNACKIRFKLEKWQNITIHEEKELVTDTDAAEKARDIGDVVLELKALTQSFMELGWLYEVAYTITELTERTSQYVQLRPGGKGFNWILPVIYSGEGGIVKGVVKADANVLAGA